MTDAENNSEGPDPTDIARGNWVDHWLPTFLRPYARLARWDRPIGTWLLFLPCLWGVALFANGSDASWGRVFELVALFAIGSFAMRGAGCTWNDITDRHIDGQVARTATRPIPSGQVSVNQALVFIVLQALIGLLVLTQLSWAASITAIASLGIVAIYPFMKRFTYFPQAFLGLAFNWGILVAGVELAGGFHPAILLLYAAGFCWTMSYDTIYAHQDKEDDVLIGVKSTALMFGRWTRPILAGFMAATIVLVVLAALSWDSVGRFFWLAMVVAGGHFVYQLSDLDFEDPANCLHHFKGNRDAGMFIALALVLASVYADQGLS